MVKMRPLQLSIYLPWLLALATIAGCTPANVAPASQQASLSAGTILSIRAVNAASEAARLRTLLDDSGDHGRTAQALAEFIVRADDGATLSIVQVNDPAFRAGERVIILRDAQTRLARPG